MAIASEGEDFVVEHLDRAYRGRQRTVLRVNGRTGDVEVVGRLTINGLPVIVPQASQFLQTNVASDEFTPTPGQTSFTLHTDPAGVITMHVNGVLQTYGSTRDFTASGRTITWLNNGYELATTDYVLFDYPI